MFNMHERNMPCRGQTIDHTIDQENAGYLHPDPNIIMGAGPNIHHSSSEQAINPLPDHLGSTMYYGMTPYNATPFYGPGAFPNSINYGSFNHFGSSSNHGIPTDEYGRNIYSDKMKNAEGFPNFSRFDASASSSSSVAPMITNHPAMMEVGFQPSMRSMSGVVGLETILPHNHSQFVQGNHMAAFQRVGSGWRDQPPANHATDGNTSAWSQAANVTYMPNTVNGGYVDTGNMCVQGYPEIFDNRGSTTYMHPPPFHHHYHYPPPLPPPLVHGGGLNVCFFPQRNMPHNMVRPHNSMETAARGMRPVLPTGLRMFRTRHGGDYAATQRDHNHPLLRVLPAEEVAVLEMSDFHEVTNLIDHHRDLRLDIEDMSYEELLRLSEQIGTVSTGLTEETIESNLKTRLYSSPPATNYNLEKEPCPDQEFDACIICQSDYENQEKVGTLDCGHEYHGECLKKWLLVKNVCPICKASALTIERKNIN